MAQRRIPEPAHAFNRLSWCKCARHSVSICTENDRTLMSFLAPTSKSGQCRMSGRSLGFQQDPRGAVLRVEVSRASFLWLVPLESDQRCGILHSFSKAVDLPMSLTSCYTHGYRDDRGQKSSTRHGKLC